MQPEKAEENKWGCLRGHGKEFRNDMRKGRRNEHLCRKTREVGCISLPLNGESADREDAQRGNDDRHGTGGQRCPEDKRYFFDILDPGGFGFSPFFPCRMARAFR